MNDKEITKRTPADKPSCSLGCLGFKIGNEGELWPCEACGLTDEEVHNRVCLIMRKHPPAKPNHPPFECDSKTCRGWDVFSINGSERIQSEFAILRNDSCGVFDSDDDAVSSACAFLHEVTGAPYDKLLADRPKKWCVKCKTPMFYPEKAADRCVECADDRVMPWQESKDDWLCDCCSKNIADVVPSCDYNNTLAEALGVVLCEPCWETLRELPINNVVRKIATKWRANGAVDEAERLCRQFHVTP